MDTDAEGSALTALLSSANDSTGTPSEPATPLTTSGTDVSDRDTAVSDFSWVATDRSASECTGTSSLADTSATLLKKCPRCYGYGLTS